MKFLFDIGGSKMRISATEDGESLYDPVIHRTPKTAEDGVELMSHTVRSMVADKDIEGFWGGITGVWNEKRDRLVYSPNMKGWVGKDLPALFKEKFSVPLVVGNDADVVGLGEVHYGAGRGSSICVYITISTGVGGARIVNGRIDVAMSGFEPGHHIINYTPLEEQGAGSDEKYSSTFEGHVSGTALKRMMGVDPVEIEEPEVWERLAFQSAVGIYNAILFWSPDTVVVGGSMVVGDPDIPIDRIRYHIEKLGDFLPELPKIKKAELGAIGGIYGALALAKQCPV
ncbi:MAG: ROK family protein [Candidatus Paceibacterota bacterium]